MIGSASSGWRAAPAVGGTVRGMAVSDGAVPAGVSLRPATVADAEALAHSVIDGFESYRSFAPAGWAPPAVGPEVEQVRRLLAGREYWCLLAEEEDGTVAGHVAVLPAALAGMPVDDQRLAHLRTLFVRRDLWGSGLARALHRAAVGQARSRGFAAMRLFTPVAQGRARRFYEREGWAPYGEAFYAAGPDLELIEYRLAL